MAADPEGYLFAYFTGDSLDGEAIRFAVSDGNDGLRWRALAGGRPMLLSTLGTRGVRDPFLIRKEHGEGFVLLATDLSIGSGVPWEDAVRWGSRSIEVWESEDLVSWSAQRHVEIAPPSAGNAWAPEATFDHALGRYVVYWASQRFAAADARREEASHHVMLAVTTADFREFSEPFVWLDPGWSVIDATVVNADGVLHRFTKDEGGATGCADIIQERSSAVLERSMTSGWQRVAECIGASAGLGAVEGPIAVVANPGDRNGPGVYLFVDEYAGRGYVPLFARDIEKPDWRIPSEFQLPPNARHGSILPITAEELERLEALID